MKTKEEGADSSENDADLEEERELQKLMTKAREEIRAKKTVEDEEEKAMFKNPLLAFKAEPKKKKKKDGEIESEEWSDDDKYDTKEDEIKEEETRNVLLLPRKDPTVLA